MQKEKTMPKMLQTWLSSCLCVFFPFLLTHVLKTAVVSEPHTALSTRSTQKSYCFAASWSNFTGRVTCSGRLIKRASFCILTQDCSREQMIEAFSLYHVCSGRCNLVAVKFDQSISCPIATHLYYPIYWHERRCEVSFNLAFRPQSSSRLRLCHPNRLPSRLDFSVLIFRDSRVSRVSSSLGFPLLFSSTTRKQNEWKRFSCFQLRLYL